MLDDSYMPKVEEARMIRDKAVSQAESDYAESLAIADRKCQKALLKAHDAESRANAGEKYDIAEEDARELLDLEIAQAGRNYEKALFG